jgi:hypothetical protein
MDFTRLETKIAMLRVGDVVKVNRYDSYPHDATMKVSFELAEVMAGAYRGSITVRWRTGPNKGSLSTIMSNTVEPMHSVIDQLAAIPEAGKIRIEPWSARDDVTSSTPPSE